VIGALIIRETRTGFADAKLGNSWTLIWPVLHIPVIGATVSGWIREVLLKSGFFTRYTCFKWRGSISCCGTRF
jgi:ABC-type polysaccharide/polyol phosphate export permease